MKTAEYDESLNLVTLNLQHGTVLSPDQAYGLYLALSEVLLQLPQPLKEERP